MLEQVGEAGLARLLVLEPTWYHTLTATTGCLWSSCTTTVGHWAG